MKKRLTSALGLVLAVLLVLALRPMPARAAAISFSGRTSLHSGDSVTVTCAISGSGILAVQGQLSYDQDALDLISAESLLGSSWQMDQNGSTILLRDNSLQDPINGTVPVFSVTFRVRQDATPGSSVQAAIRDVMVSDGDDDTALGGDSWSADILRPYSSNNKLAHLGCGDGELSPAFDPGVTDYRIKVPFSVESLSLSTEPDHSRSKVSVSGNDSLTVGDNTITITVTAENGSTRRYFIYAERGQDPNYVPNDDARLAGLTPSHGRLSPEFSPKIREYVVYVPYETTSIRMDATPRDSLAHDVTGLRKTKLDVGDNLLKVKCIAEDEETFKVYQVHVWRMPLFAGTLPEIIPPKEELPPEGETPPPAPEEAPSDEKLPTDPIFQLDSGTTALVACLMLLCCGVAALFWYLGSRNERGKYLPGAPSHGTPLTVNTPVSCYEDENFPPPPAQDSPDDDQPLADAALCSDFVPLEREHPSADGIAPIPWKTADEALDALEALRLPSTDNLPTSQEILDVLEQATPLDGEPAAETAAPVEEPPAQEAPADDSLHIPEDLSDDDAVEALAEQMIRQMLPNHAARLQDDPLHGMSVDDFLKDMDL